MMKAVSSIELGMDTLTHKPFEELDDDEIVAHMHVQDAERVFCVYEALKRGIDHQTIYNITKIDWWFLDKMQHLANLENGLKKCHGTLSGRGGRPARGKLPRRLQDGGYLRGGVLRQHPLLLLDV